MMSTLFFFFFLFSVVPFLVPPRPFSLFLRLLFPLLPFSCLSFAFDTAFPIAQMDNNEKGHGANYNEDEARLAAVRNKQLTFSTTTKNQLFALGNEHE